MANKPGEANFFPDVPQFPSMGTFQPVYGKFDLTTYIQGASDYEIMAFLVGKYNACLEAYGNITKLSTDTITAAHQLQDWINNWFDNLDVQEELNNKIDSMVQDGSFGTLLHRTFDEQINQQTTNAVTAWLVTNVTPTGSAVVVDKSLTINGAAADAGVTGNYINLLAAGAIYNFADSWTYDNGTYTYSITSGDYVFAQNYTKLLYKLDSKTVAYKPTAQSTTLLCYIHNNSLKIIEIGYTVDKPSTQFNTNDIIISIVFVINDKIYPVFSLNNGRVNKNYYQMLAAGAIYDFADSWSYDDNNVYYEWVSGNYIYAQNYYVDRRELNTTKISYPISNTTLIVYIRNKTLNFANILGAQDKPYEGFKVGDLIIAIGFIMPSGQCRPVFSISKQEQVENTSISSNTSAILAKVVCCGDSYTSGHIQVDGEQTNITNENFAWPHYMEKITGNQYINCGVSGANVITWQTAERGLPKARTSGLTQAYIIGLGLNDQSDYANVPVGTADDIGTENQTYYAQYSKIVRELHNISPNAYIFCQTMPFGYANYNNAIVTIVNTYASTYNTKLLDLRNYTKYYNMSSVAQNVSHGHYLAAGYQQLAEILNIVLSDYINAHPLEFRNVNTIPFE